MQHVRNPLPLSSLVECFSYTQPLKQVIEKLLKAEEEHDKEKIEGEEAAPADGEQSLIAKHGYAIDGNGTEIEGSHGEEKHTQEFTAQQVAAGRTLVKEEVREQGAVSVHTYLAYVRAAGGLLVVAVMLLFFTAGVGSKVFSDFWLSYWIRQGDGKVKWADGFNYHVGRDEVKESEKEQQRKFKMNSVS